MTEMTEEETIRLADAGAAVIDSLENIEQMLIGAGVDAARAHGATAEFSETIEAIIDTEAELEAKGVPAGRLFEVLLVAVQAGIRYDRLRRELDATGNYRICTGMAGA